MGEICNICGLPKEICACETIAKESQTINVSIIKKKFGKKYTLIQGINPKQIDVKEVTKKLKSKFACGGTAKEGNIELQGDHLGKIKQELVSLGFPPDAIEVKEFRGRK